MKVKLLEKCKVNGVVSFRKEIHLSPFRKNKTEMLDNHKGEIYYY